VSDVVSKGEEAGLPWLILKTEWETLCGYVGLPKEHPLAGTQETSESPMQPARTFDTIYNWWMEGHSIVCHGGLTFSGWGDGELRPEGFYWLGFDCNHAGDLAPGLPGGPLRDDVYRDEEYVEGECRKLARQIAAVTGGDDGE